MQEEMSRRHILDAAERVFGRRGFHEATLRDIAAEAEFSTGSIYNFFENKDDLFSQVMARKGEGLLQALQAAVEESESPREKLHALADAQLTYYSEHRDFYRLIMRSAGPAWWTMKAELDDSSVDRFRRAIDLETDVFRQGTATGDFRSLDPETMAVMFLGMMQAYLTRWLLGADDDVDAIEQGFSRSDLHDLLDRAFSD